MHLACESAYVDAEAWCEALARETGLTVKCFCSAETPHRTFGSLRIRQEILEHHNAVLIVGLRCNEVVLLPV